MENQGSKLDNIEIDRIAIEAIRIEYEEFNKKSDEITTRANTVLIASSVIAAFLSRESSTLFLLPLSFAAISVVTSLLAIYPRGDFLRIHLADIRDHKYKAGDNFYNYIADAYISSSEKNRVNNDKRFFKLKIAVFSLILSTILLVFMLIFKGVSMSENERDTNQTNVTVNVSQPSQSNGTSDRDSTVSNGVTTQKPVVNRLQHVNNSLDNDAVQKPVVNRLQQMNDSLDPSKVSKK